MSKKFVGFWNVSVILTYIELCIAVGSICVAADGKAISREFLFFACYFICSVIKYTIKKMTSMKEWGNPLFLLVIAILQQTRRLA